MLRRGNTLLAESIHDVRKFLRSPKCVAKLRTMLPCNSNVSGQQPLLHVIFSFSLLIISDYLHWSLIFFKKYIFFGRKGKNTERKCRHRGRYATLTRVEVGTLYTRVLTTWLPDGPSDSLSLSILRYRPQAGGAATNLVSWKQWYLHQECVNQQSTSHLVLLKGQCQYFTGLIHH